MSQTGVLCVNFGWLLVAKKYNVFLSTYTKHTYNTQARSRSIENVEESPIIIQGLHQSAGRRAAHSRAPHQEALNYDPQTFVSRTSIGQMDNVCVCGARKFKAPSVCCSKQQVSGFISPPA